MNTKLKQAFDTLCDELKKDDGYFYAWQSNIAVCFQDECHRQGINFPQLHETSNNAAISFLRLLISKSTTEQAEERINDKTR